MKLIEIWQSKTRQGWDYFDFMKSIKTVKITAMVGKFISLLVSYFRRTTSDESPHVYPWTISSGESKEAPPQPLLCTFFYDAIWYIVSKLRPRGLPRCRRTSPRQGKTPKKMRQHKLPFGRIIMKARKHKQADSHCQYRCSEVARANIRGAFMMDL